MNLQISSEIVCKANGRDFWLLAEKANKDKAKMKKPRPKTQEGTKEKGVEGKGEGKRKRDPTNRWLWPLSRNDLKIQDWEQELNFLSAFMCQVSWAPSTLLPLPLPSPAATFSRLSRCAARQLAMPTMTSRTTLGPFALLYYTRIIFKSQLGCPPSSPLGVYSWKGLEKQFWKFIFINFNSLQKFCVSPLRHLCIGHGHSSARQGQRGGGEDWGTRGVVGANNYFFRFGQLVPF